MEGDLLSALRAQLAEQQAARDRAQTRIDDLTTAISALESKYAGDAAHHVGIAHDDPEPMRRRLPRGKLMDIGLQCVASGRGTAKQMRQACLDAGINVTPASISNVIQRLQRNQLIQAELNGKSHHYVLRQSAATQRENLVRDLEGSLKIAEGSKVVPLKPPVANGGPASTSLGGV